MDTISFVIPVHNESAILSAQVAKMIGAFREKKHSFELLLVENGSTDPTPSLCHSLAKEYPEIRVLSSPEPDYGLALKYGILEARKNVVIIFNIEFWNVEFVQIAMTALETRDLVIGSKSAPGAHDERPWIRRTITRTYNRMLRLLWRFDGTDTHGMKAFRKEKIVSIAESCVTRGFVFDTELVLRVEAAGFSKIEIPTDVAEIRSPTAISLFKRIPAVLSNLWVLMRHFPPFR